MAKKSTPNKKTTTKAPAKSTTKKKTVHDLSFGELVRRASKIKPPQKTKK